MGSSGLVRYAIAVSASVLLTGCASDIMKGYVGQPLQAAMVDYGPPSNAFDMGDGRRAFQWAMASSYTTPTYVQNQGSATPLGNAVWWTQNTQIIGGQTVETSCNYTLYGRWDDSANVWRIEGFEKPKWACQ